MDIDTDYKKSGFWVKAYNYFIFFIASVFFGYVTVRMVFPVIGSSKNPLKGIAAIVVFSLCFVALWAIDRFLVRKMNRKAAKTAVISLVSLNAVLQVLCLYYLKVKPSWDFGAVMTAADDIAAGHVIHNWSYFQEYPYNLYPAVIVGTFKFLLGGSPFAPYLLNILSVTSSILGVCLLTYKLYGHRAAVLAALFCIAATPFYLYIPIVYTDTLSMPFVIWTVYVWSFIKAGGKRLLLLCALIGLLSALGFLIKQIAAIGLAAFLVDFVIDRRKYIPGKYPPKSVMVKFLRGLFPLAAALSSFILIVIAFRFYVDYKGFDSRLDPTKRLPFTHWLMMGMNTIPLEGGTSTSYGGFSVQDLKFSRTYKTTSEKENANLEMIKKRLQQFRIAGYSKFLLKKIEWTWTDGTYFAPVKLGRYPLKRTILHKFVLFSNGKANKLYLAFTQFVQTVILSMILIGCITSLKKGPDSTFRLMSLMSLGLMFFLLFWETRSRYLTFMLPVFVVMTIYGTIFAFGEIDDLFSYLRKRDKFLQ